MSTLSTSLPGGTWTLGDLTVTRFGYGAMQLAGPGVMGPPADRDSALAVLREAAGFTIQFFSAASGAKHSAARWANGQRVCCHAALRRARGLGLGHCRE